MVDTSWRRDEWPVREEGQYVELLRLPLLRLMVLGAVGMENDRWKGIGGRAAAAAPIMGIF